MRILLVEDDAIIGDGLVVGLEKQGFVVDWLQDGHLAKEALLAEHEAVILDLTLPGADGLELLQYWRQKGHEVPILILTARGSIEQRVEGLNLGADDYLPKPFALQELIARVRALLRRKKSLAETLLRHKNVSFDPQKRLAYKDDKPIALSPKGMILLEIFLTHADAVLSKTVLEEKLYGWNDEVSSNTIEVHVHHLRSKFGSDFIRTVHGIGYILSSAGK